MFLMWDGAQNIEIELAWQFCIECALIGHSTVNTATCRKLVMMEKKGELLLCDQLSYWHRQD